MKKKLSPSLSGCNTSERFAFATDEELAKLAEEVVPANTAKITNWALKNFQLWMTNRNISHPNDLILSDIFQCTDTQTLSKHFSRFVVETRKSNGELYPPATWEAKIPLAQISYTRIVGLETFMELSIPTFINSTQMELEHRQNILRRYHAVKRTNYGAKE